MGVLSTGFRSYFVDATVEIRPQEGAGRLIQHIIFILIQVYVGFHKLAGFHSEVLSYAANVYVRKDWTYGLTAIRTGKAIHLFKDLIIQILYGFIQLLEFTFPELPEKFICLRTTSSSFLQILFVGLIQVFI